MIETERRNPYGELKTEARRGRYVNELAWYRYEVFLPQFIPIYGLTILGLYAITIMISDQSPETVFKSLVVIALMAFLLAVYLFVRRSSGAVPRLVRIERQRIQFFKRETPTSAHDLMAAYDLADIAGIYKGRTTSKGGISLTFIINPFEPVRTMKFTKDVADWIVHSYTDIVNGGTICKLCCVHEADFMHDCGGSFCWSCLDEFWTTRTAAGAKERVCPRCSTIVMK